MSFIKVEIEGTQVGCVQDQTGIGPEMSKLTINTLSKVEPSC